MAFHIPFNQRPSGQPQGTPARPVYIGFDIPAPSQRRKFNWWGFNGMWMSFASLLTAGFLSPIPLLVSLKGLRRPGKKMATVGTLTSLGGIGLATAIVLAGVSAHRHNVEHRQAKHYQQVVTKQIAETQTLLSTASEEITEYRDHNDGEFPDAIDANMLVIKYVDPWGESLRYDAEVGLAIVRSAGPDRQFDSKDDVKIEIEGKTDRERLLSVEK